MEDKLEALEKHFPGPFVIMFVDGSKCRLLGKKTDKSGFLSIIVHIVKALQVLSDQAYKDGFEEGKKHGK